tara:strand:+ start:666 stop:1658 length:993 start_codon:yes stop_codon:yes gene_type:complete
LIPYIGGKQRMAPWIHSFIPSGIETYVEVFGGAFWVYMKSDVDNPLAKQHIYNDFNPYMVNLYRCASNPKQLSKFIDSKNVPLQSGENKSPLDECRKFFYQCKDDMFASTFAITTLRKILEDKSIVKKERKALNETLDFARKRRTEVNGQISEKFGEKIKAGRKDQMAAMQYVFLLTNCFSGAAAVEATFTDDSKKNSSKFAAFHKKLTDEGNVRRLKNITACENMSFEEVIAKYDSPTTYFYCDPPYWNTEDYYSLHGFGREEHFQLMDCLHNMKGKFSLSYYDFDGLNDMYPKDQYKWETKEFVKASGARDGEAQSIGEEVLIMNYQP